ncbi:hypothetical protein [Spirillospora sp. NPDC047279]|uniref:hypothetical protein n=1 Tax=Spirillospora sp. NPDC047279 TaxID=3155478 RepID=UPI0033D2664D
MSDEREAGRTEPGGPGRLSGAWRAAVPVAAAVGIAAVVGGGLDFVNARGDSQPKKAASKSATTSAPKPGKSGPRYVVGVRRAGTALVVRDARTGKDVGVPVAAPQGRRFQRVATGADGGYVVAAKAGGKVVFQRLVLDEKGRPTSLAAIPGTDLAGESTAWSDLAVTPDGNRIAYVTYRGTRSRLDVISVADGARTTWTTRTPARLSSLSWAGDTLSFVWNPVRSVNGRLTEIRHQVRTLDTTGRGGDLVVSKAVLKLPEGSETAVLSRDGQNVVAGVIAGSKVALHTFSVRTGQPAEVLWSQPVAGGGEGAGTAQGGGTGDGPGTGGGGGAAGTIRARLDVDATGGHLLFTGSDGRLYVKGGPAVPGQDLDDAAW